MTKATRPASSRERHAAPGSSSRGAWQWPELRDFERDVLREILVHGPSSRADMARRLGFSRPTLTRIARTLLDVGLVTEGETAAAVGRGRPSETLHLRPDAAYFIGVNLTGDRMYVVLTDLAASVVHSEEHALPDRRIESVIGLIGAVVRAIAGTFVRVAAIGVCLAGDVGMRDGREVIVHSDFLGWDEEPIADLVAAATGGMPTAAANDVQSLTLAHHWFGAGVARSSFALIGFGAGIGCGLVVNSELIRGARGRPGKVDHTLVTDSGPTCDRGHVGCVSAFATTSAIARNSGLDENDYATAWQRAIDGDQRALAAFRAAGRALGVVIAEVANLFDPENVILTGEGLAVVELAGRELDDGVRERLNPLAEQPVIDVREFSFSDYAWAAAIGAIRRVV